jgi:hypothetical protein
MQIWTFGSAMAAGIIALPVKALKNGARGDHMSRSAMAKLDCARRPFIEIIPLGWFMTPVLMGFFAYNLTK